MISTETLFGGLLAVVLLFFVARRLGLSHYWSSVLSGTLPFLVYLGFQAADMPSGDVIAMHFVVYVATAAVLGVFTSMQKKKEPMHWGPKLIIGFFVALVLMMAALLVVAMQGLPDWLAQRILPNARHVKLHTGFPGAIAHDRNKLYEAHQQRIETQRNLGWKVQLAGLEHLRKGVPGELTLSVTDEKGAPVDVESVTLDLWRIANSRDDRKVEMAAATPGVFHVGITFPDAGRWIVEMEISRGNDNYLAQQPFVIAE